MNIRRVVPDIVSANFDASRAFYGEFLGMRQAMDMGFIVTFVSTSNETAQVNVVREGDGAIAANAVGISIEVENVNEMHARAVERGLEIVYPLTDEPWGVRQFRSRSEWDCGQRDESFAESKVAEHTPPESASRFESWAKGKHMRKWLIAFALITGTTLPAFGQAVGPKQNPKHVPVQKVEARPEDVGSIEAIVKASYETISGGVGVPRQWGRDESLFDPNVRFVAVERDPKSGAIVAMITTHQEFVDDADGSLVKEGFTERELGRSIQRYGNVATVLSSYEGKNASTGKVITRGVNIFQLYFDGKRWWILSMVWDQESPQNPIPADLLPKN